MDDIMNALSQAMNDPNAIQQLSQIASSLMQGNDGDTQSTTNIAQQQAPPADISAMLSSLLSSGSADNSTAAADSSSVPFAAPQTTAQANANAPQLDIAKLMQIGNLISGSGAGDKNIAFLMALKPLLKEENHAKVDRIIKIFRLMAAYPIIRDSGLLGGDLFG